MRVGRNSFITPTYKLVTCLKYFAPHREQARYSTKNIQMHCTSGIVSPRVGRHSFNVPRHIHVDAYNYLRPRLIVRLAVNTITHPRTRFGRNSFITPEHTLVSYLKQSALHREQASDASNNSQLHCASGATSLKIYPPLSLNM